MTPAATLRKGPILAIVLASYTMIVLDISIVITALPQIHRGLDFSPVVSYYAAVAGVASTVGLVAGGIFAGWLSWRIGFVINLPIGVAMTLAAPRFLPETEPRRGQTDAIGAVSSTLGMAAMVFGIVHSADAGWGSPLTLACVAAGALLLALFVVNSDARRSRSCRCACSAAGSAPVPTPRDPTPRTRPASRYRWCSSASARAAHWGR